MHLKPRYLIAALRFTTSLRPSVTLELLSLPYLHLTVLSSVRKGHPAAQVLLNRGKLAGAVFLDSKKAC